MSVAAVSVLPARPETEAVNPWLIAMVVMLATFMEVLDTSIANVSLPHIAGTLSATPDESTWVLTSYLVSNAIVLPLSGWLSNIFGRKRFYIACVIVFTVSSFLCGLAPSLGSLIFFRILQGLGGGGLQPSAQAFLADAFPPEKRGMGFSVYAMAVVFAPAIGPTLGGWITDNFSWRWIFYINVPVGIVSVLLSSRLLRDPAELVQKARRLGSRLRIDYIGLGLLVVGLGFLQVVLDKGQQDDWFGSHFIAWSVAISAIALISVVVWELRTSNPIVDLRLFAERNFAISNILIFALGFALFGSTVLIPQFLQELMGYTATQSGQVLSPSGILLFLLLPITGMMINKVGAKRLIVFGFIIAGSSLWLCAHISLGIDFWTITLYRMAQGLGIAFLFTPISTTCFSRIPRDKTNAASALYNLSRNLGASFGIATVTTVLARRAQVHQANLNEHVTNGSAAYQSLVAGLAQRLQQSGSTAVAAAEQARIYVGRLILQQATALAFLDCFMIMCVFCFAMIPICLFIKSVKPQPGQQIHAE